MAPGTIVGVVVDESTGTGVPSAAVSMIGRQREGHSIGAMTDASGQFHFTFAPFDSFTIRAGRIAYSELFRKVRLDPARGYAVVLAVAQRQGFIDCPLPTVLTVVVREVRSGQAPSGGATVWLSAAGYRDSTSIRSPPNDSAMVIHVGTAAGLTAGVFEKYSILVQSPGFRPWRADRVRGVVEPCSGLSFSPLHVWLLPL